MLIEQLKPEIDELVRSRQWELVRERLADWPPAEIAELLLSVDKLERALLFRLLSRRRAAEVFSVLAREHRDALLIELTDHETRQLLATLSPDDRTALLEELPGDVTRRLLNLLSPADLMEARQLLGYPEESIGRLMTPDYAAVRPAWTVERALEHIRRFGRDSETINTVYVVDESGKLLNDVRLRRLMLADPKATVEEMTEGLSIGLSAFDDREEAVRVMRRYDLESAPVVDSDGILVGIITVDDILDVAEEEATEDIHLAGSVAPLGRSYSSSTIGILYQKRIGWLVALVFVNLISSGVIAFFEDTLEAVLALAFFIPLLIGTGGNTGSQSATLVIRALVTDDVKMNQWLHVLSKELAVGATLGLTLGVVSSSLGLWRGGLEVGLVVGLTMVCIVIAANIIGMTLPFVLSRVKLDPAVASSPLIATTMDATGLIIYFSIATLLLI